MPSSTTVDVFCNERAVIVRYTEVKGQMEYCMWDSWRINIDQKAPEMSFT